MSSIGDLANQVERAHFKLRAMSENKNNWNDDQRRRFDTAHLGPLEHDTNQFRIALWQLDTALGDAERLLR